MSIKLDRKVVAPLIGAIYGIFIRLVFEPPSFLQPFSTKFGAPVLWIMSFGFLAVVPFVMGWLTIAEDVATDEADWVRWITKPWLSVLFADLGLVLASIEGLICLAFAIPITCFFSSVGGISAGLTHRNHYLRSRATTVCMALLPFLITVVEMQHQPPLDLRSVQNSIVIHAPTQIVWDNIKTVPAIQHSEIRTTWTHRIGFPLPIAATLDHEGVGGIRHATFEHGLLFIETVTRWEPLHDLAFTIKADTKDIPPTTLDEHVTIGGPFFDVLNGEYRIEPLPDGSILLHLTSHQRLNTDFNGYAHLWTDAVMSDLQKSILEVIKHRCEASNIKHPDILNP